MAIHPTAHIDPRATLGDRVSIGPGAIIGPDVSLGDDCEVAHYATITGTTTIGARCRIYPHAIIGMDPQDKRYAGEPTETILGDDNILREFVTIHRGTAHGHGRTVIGNRNLLMANVHVAHDCTIGHECIFSNVATLAGHCEIGDFATIGGLSALHQFTRVGPYAFIGGCSAVSQDVPPFFLASGNHAATAGINKVGLQRRGFSEDEVRSLLTCFKIIYLRDKRLQDALEEMEGTWPDSPHVASLVTFIRKSKRGILKYGKPTA